MWETVAQPMYKKSCSMGAAPASAAAANVNVKQGRKVVRLAWTKPSSAMSQLALYGCPISLLLPNFILALLLLIS